MILISHKKISINYIIYKILGLQQLLFISHTLKKVRFLNLFLENINKNRISNI